MTAPTWPQVTEASTSLRTVGGCYRYVADALEHDHQSLNPLRKAPMTDLEAFARLTALRDKAWAARQAARLTRSCNPRTEFEAGWAARDAVKE